MAGWAAGRVKVLSGFGGGRGKADVEAKGLELTDVPPDLSSRGWIGGRASLGAEVGVAGFRVRQEVPNDDEDEAGGGAPGAERPWVRRLSGPGDAIARGLGAAARLAARVTYIERRARVWELVAEQAARRGGRVSAADVCAAVVPGVQVTGAWLSAAPDAQAGHLMQVTDEVSRQLAELQLALGEGPLLDASGSGGPVLASDLADAESGVRWPAFATAACRAGAAALFAFPLVVGAIRAGVLGLYRDRPGPLSDFQLGDALVFADTATMLLLDAQDPAAGAVGPGAGPGGQPAGLASHRAEIDQATGMLTEQLGVSVTDAFVRLRAYAYANDLQLAGVARDIVARRLRLFPDPDLSLRDET